jgi:hypothetical protein
MARSAIDHRPRSAVLKWPAIRTGSLKAELLPALAAALLATAIGVWALQLWKTTLHIPIFVSPGDTLFNLIMIKDVIQHGWDLTNPSLGAPIGQEVFDYPALSGDSFYLVIIKALGIFSSNPAMVLNIFYLLCFPLIALTSFGTMRKLGVSAYPALVCAVLYAVLPFRFQSGEQHVFVSAYFTVPVSCYLVLVTFKGSEIFLRDGRHAGLRGYLTWRSAGLVAVFLVIGSADSYFALFTVALMVPAAILALLATRRPRPFLGAALAASVIIAAVALNGLPTIIYDAQHGSDTVATTRLPYESSLYGLSLASMVMPIEDNRIPLLANLTESYDTTTIIPKSTPGSEPTFTSLGLVGTLGLLWLLSVLGIHCLRREGAKPSDLRGVHAALGASLAFLIGTAGGLATLFAYVVTPQLHAPGRIYLFIAFFAMLGAALGLDRLHGRIVTRPRGQSAFIAILAILLLVGVLYQTSPAMIPNYPANTNYYNVRRAFAQGIESRVPGNGSIFEIPYVPFPQGVDPGKIAAYENLWGYIFSNRLRWSGGAMEGRRANWVPAFLDKPLAQVLAGVCALGFKGISVDTAGLPEEGAQIVPALTRALGVSPLRSAEGRFLFFDMANYNQRFRQQHSRAQIRAIAAAALNSQS